MVIGSMFGALVGGLQCQFVGRKKSLIIDNVVIFGGLIALRFSYSIWSLLLCRFVLGFSVASLFVNVPSYTGEICQPTIRMITGSFAMVCNSFGMCSMMVIGAFLSWRTAIIVISAIPIFVIFLLIVLVPESPIWLLMNNKHDEAKKSLVRLRGNMLVVESELSRLQKSLILQKAESQGKEEDGCCSGLREIMDALKDKSFLKPFSILLFLHCIGFEWIGLAFIAYYMVGIMIEANIPFSPYFVCAGISIFRLILIMIFSVGIANRVKRRPLYISTAVVIIIGNTSMATYFLLKNNFTYVETFPSLKWIPVICILVIYAAFAFGYGCIPYMLQGEILPPYARAVGSGLLGLISNFSMFITLKVGPTISESIGMDGIFYMFSGVAIANAIFAYCTVPETFNLSLEEIEKIYQSKDQRQKKPRKSRSASMISFYEVASPYGK